MAAEINCVPGCEIIGHRGASYEAPENTLAAIRLAWLQHADAVEVDVHLSRDDHLVVIHDAHTRRTGRVGGRVRNRTLDQLRGVDVGRWRGPQWTGERIPTLDEAIATIPDGKRLFVEFKCGPEAVTSFKCVVRRSGKLMEQIVPIGFNLVTMEAVKTAVPRLEVYWGAQFRRRSTIRRWLPTAEDLIRKASAAHLDGLDVDARGPIDARFVQQVKSAGLKLFVWTVNSAARARPLVRAGVDGITTDRPGWLREKLQL